MYFLYDSVSFLVITEHMRKHHTASITMLNLVYKQLNRGLHKY